jgi:hypothetical protein
MVVLRIMIADFPSLKLDLHLLSGVDSILCKKVQSFWTTSYAQTIRVSIKIINIIYFL